MKACWAVLAAAALLTGCGHGIRTAAPLSTGSAPITVKAVPITLLHDSPAIEAPTAVAEPLPTAVVSLGLAAPGCLGLNACHDGTPLTLQSVDKQKKGLLWRKLHVEGKAHNPGTMALSGEVKIKFLKKGEVTQTEIRSITNLAAGQSLPFLADSNDASDDAEITVTTQGMTTAQAR
ncbi:MAG: hypothetical protein JWM80_4984 [Cyanobacteria bacterium RYN_339]|nr:hypothetical protein [Cyanobacteria bacterium RYN_339]